MKTEAEKLPFTNENLKQLIVACLDAESAINEISKTPLKEEPEKPIKISVSEYNDYASKLSSWKSEINEFKKKRDLLYDDLEQRKVELQNIIPDENIWFVTDCGKYAAAIKMDVWGDINLTLLFTNKTSDLKKINYVIV